jgi:predicted aspartyl protease
MITTGLSSDRSPAMGRFTVQLELLNHHDVLRAEDGVIREDQIRRSRIAGIVATGAARLVLSATVVAALGLPETGKTTVKYADGRRDQKKVVGESQLEIQGRRCVFSAVVEPNGTDALIGAIVLEELDLLPDCTTHSLVPRDVDLIVTELEYSDVTQRRRAKCGASMASGSPCENPA